MSALSGRRRWTVGRVAHRLAVAVLVLWLVAPFAWMVVYSVYPSTNLRATPMSFDPGDLTLTEYADLLSDPSFLLPMRNSAVVGAATTVLCMLLGSLAAYSISRFRFRGSQTLLLSMMTVQAIPAIVLAVPLFVLMRDFGLYDTLVGLVLTYAAFILPLVIWMMVSFFDSIPVNLEKAARIDGCGRLGVLRRVVLPLSGPGFAATAIFAFITAWSDFFLAKILTGPDAETLPVRTASFQGLFAMDYTAAATAGVITALPVLALALVAQRWIVQGITEGAVKG
ncbi:carbohydrate ABC transporter permease [Phycicoccus endophyticus]|uniref:Carbohydrate ABC transporter permease n=1 Tax=Phycicoccus endophyticus TaxID=1690220 RepID=A0A7G9QZX5_9MICO|nr:carbohydrate ABC transporter permease [Phycicoccus endophyticus]NHI20754.1 carbohydrate ABC transporter permease [Phycicoccus endophyticus]QNN48900.1 carbohydrate ABC transporter permease [Phycicoccus endophyticus]GGL43663.1 sugar ABC transporter permease [Phycicoccus endophyticus]